MKPKNPRSLFQLPPRSKMLPSAGIVTSATSLPIKVKKRELGAGVPDVVNKEPSADDRRTPFNHAFDPVESSLASSSRCGRLHSALNTRKRGAPSLLVM